LEKREKSRGDRIIGTNRFQYTKMKDLKWEYDLKIDNSKVSALDNAKKVLSLVSFEVKKT
jgi:chloramphenicol 3-O-phosphotransferase